MWGEADLIWTQGVIELFRWRRQRKAVAAQAAELVAEAEQFLAGLGTRPPSPEPPRWSEPPLFG
jgi:hypothetical protein